MSFIAIRPDQLVNITPIAQPVWLYEIEVYQDDTQGACWNDVVARVIAIAFVVPDQSASVAAALISIDSTGEPIWVPFTNTTRLVYDTQPERGVFGLQENLVASSLIYSQCDDEPYDIFDMLDITTDQRDLKRSPYTVCN
jgi:hypothetical protein